ncbi:CpaF family protein [Citrobacter rodentium]|uniref:Tight adherence protein A n=2 Tax=Citrobacter rodentium TaxID=67825 RepID=D2TIT0_CITRI|nr:CpaF family protein [Citrobacter rodentium]QBY30435.1 CpaF family protein [Citrobacter rodentium]UHO32195.1 CpaF family protein [Citrobacter rodentium NBRC 105723 = DSM 16636]CBG90840.1 putative tight adherence protein A [Citrobacter rodentium ICC168]
MDRDKSSSMLLIREQVLKNLDIEKLNDLRNDRDLLIKEISDNIQKVVNSSKWYLSNSASAQLTESIVDEITGYGPLRELMDDDSISDILVNGPDHIFVERGGRLERVNKKFINNEQLTEIARRLVSKVGRRVDDSQPLVDARMPDGSRLNVVISPIALDGTSISIRKFGKGKKTLNDLIEYGSINEAMANFLVIAARSRVNIIVSGGTGSGKTTLLNALSQYISDDERVLTLEDAAELRLLQPHIVRLETRMAGSENRGVVSMRNLVVNALRMRPDRIIVGECRGEEAFEMLQAMNTGHDGSMSTLHANSPRDALARLESMVMMSSVGLPLIAIRRNIASAVNLILQVTRLPDGSRKVINITEVMGMEGENIILQDIFTFTAVAERDENDRIKGNFNSFGLLQRSAVYRNAVFHGLIEPLKQLFGKS